MSSITDLVFFFMLLKGEAYSRRFVRPSDTLSGK